MARIVIAKQPPGLSIHLDGRDSGHSVTKTPESGEIYAENLGEEREEHEIVGDEAHGLAGVVAGQGADGSDRALLYIDEALPAGHGVSRPFRANPCFEEARIARSHFAESETCNFDCLHFAKPR